MVTNVAITTMNAGMRTLSGITDFRSEMTMFDISSTKAVASPMHMPLIADVVVASVGHMPSTNTHVGFSFTSPFLIMSAAFIAHCLLSGILRMRC